MKKFLKIGFLCSLALLLGIGIFLPTRVNSQYASAYNLPKLNNDYTFGTLFDTVSFGISSMNGSYVWSDGVDYYYSNTSTGNKKLDLVNNTFTTISFNGLSSFDGRAVWSDGVHIFYSKNNSHYELDVSTYTWSSISITGYSSFTGGTSTGVNTFFVGNTCYTSGGYFLYTFDYSTYSFVPHQNYISNTLNSINTTAYNYWTDGVNWYYSASGTHYLVDFSTYIFTPISFNSSYTNFNGKNIFYIGSDIYLTDGTISYIFDSSTLSFTQVDYFTGITDSRYFWSNGIDIYYNYSSNQYVLRGTYDGGDTPDSDVVPNYPYIMPSIMEAFIGGFTGCFDFLGTSIADNFSDLFLEENINTNQLGLSVFGTLVFSFIGLCIALKVFKFIVKFIIRKGDAKYEKE